jgi:hypothetical protein
METAEKTAAGVGVRYAWVSSGMRAGWAQRVCVAALVVGVLAWSGSTAAMATTTAAGTAPPAATSVDRSQPANLDEAKQDIRTYYGDHVDGTGQHQASADSAWARRVGVVDALAAREVERRTREPAHRRMAIVLDIDDTALSTYSYSANNDFAFHDTRRRFSGQSRRSCPSYRRRSRWPGRRTSMASRCSSSPDDRAPWRMPPWTT